MESFGGVCIVIEYSKKLNIPIKIIIGVVLDIAMHVTNNRWLYVFPICKLMIKEPVNIKDFEL
jgi:hypothetical protein